MFELIINMPWYLLLFVGFAACLIYMFSGIALLLYLDFRHAWFSQRMQAQQSMFVALMLIALWPLTIFGFCLSRWYRMRRHGFDRYTPKAA